MEQPLPKCCSVSSASKVNAVNDVNGVNGVNGASQPAIARLLVEGAPRRSSAKANDIYTAVPVRGMTHSD